MTIFDEVNALDAALVAESYQLQRARERHKAACVSCSSSDALHVYPDAGAKTGRGFYCHSCGISHTNIDLVMALEGISNIDAARDLAARFGIPMEDSPEPTYFKRRREQTMQPIQAPTQEPQDAYTRIWSALTIGPEACAYLERRGISPDCAHWMGVRSVETHGELAALYASTTQDEQLRHGLVREVDGRMRRVVWDVPFLVMPYLEWCQQHDGEHGPERITLLRFAPFGAYREAHPRLKYLSPYDHRPDEPYCAWQVESAHMSSKMLGITEGEINALSLHMMGLPAIATAGAQGWRSAWASRLIGLDRVLLFADGDKAGQEWAQRITDDLAALVGYYEAQQLCVHVRLPHKQDVNDLLQSGALRQLIDEVTR